MAWGRNQERHAYENMLRQFDGHMLACVVDTYDVYDAVANIFGQDLNEVVTARDGTVVLRPDSGDPVEIVPRVLHQLGEDFGYTTNAKGYKCLHPSVRVIWGDGTNEDVIIAVLSEMIGRNWASENVAFGMGGGLTQDINRDMFGFTQKQSAVKRGETWFDTVKESPGKISRPGRHHEDPYMRLIWENGDFVCWDSIDLIRQRYKDGSNGSTIS